MSRGFLKTFKVPLLLVGLALLSYFLANYNRSQEIQKPTSADAQNSPSPRQKQTIKNQKKQSAKEQKIYSILDSTLGNLDGKFEIYIKDLKSGEIFTISPTDPFTAASIYKLAVMYKTYDAIETGQLSPDDVLSASQSDLDNQLSDSSSEDLSGDQNWVITHTVDEAITLMVTISDNYSALLLGNQLGWDNIQNFLASQGINGFTFVSENAPTTTAQASAQILEKIYRGQAVSKTASNEMEKLLLNQTLNDRIPKYLPQNIKVAHKTGELDTVRNDAGIIFGKKSDYIFVFFADTPNPDDTSEAIAKTSEQVFDALENR